LDRKERGEAKLARKGKAKRRENLVSTSNLIENVGWVWLKVRSTGGYTVRNGITSSVYGKEKEWKG
jgi:hypothetical protein